MSKEFFKNLPDTSTPLNSERLNGLLNGDESMGNITVEDIKSKNLFNINILSIQGADINRVAKTITVNRYSNGSDQILSTLAPDLKAGEEYTLSFETTGATTHSYLVGTQRIWASGYPVVLTQADLDNRINFYGEYESDAEVTISDIQIEKGNTPTPYTPYKFFGYTSDVEADILDLKQSVVETGYLGRNPNIDELRHGSGVYGLYNCEQAPVASIGVLEVLKYTADWVVQRFTDVSSGEMWQRMFRDGTTWTEWTQRW